MLFIAYDCQNRAVWNALKLHVDFIESTGESISFLVDKRYYDIIKKDYSSIMIYKYSNTIDLLKQLMFIKEIRLFSPVMFTTVYAGIVKLFKSKEIYYWVQGAVPEESFLRNQSLIRTKLLSTIEHFALLVSDKNIFVSNEMKNYLKEKHNRIFNNSIIVPCISEFSYDGSKKEKDSFVYIGGMSAWQRIDEMLKMFNYIIQIKPNAHLYIATLEQDVAYKYIEKYLDKKYHTNITLLSINDRSQITNFLSTKEYGFLIREDIVVNQVSSPIKLAEYLSCGVSVIISSAVKSYAHNIEKEGVGICIDKSEDIIHKLKTFIPNINRNIAFYNKYFSVEQHTKSYEQLINIIDFNISCWYDNYQAPSVLMIDDLSDSYLKQYSQSYKNDWGYLCRDRGSAYSFLKTSLLNKFPKIKITFFVPYLRHNVINDNTKVEYKKNNLGERSSFSNFLQYLDNEGHEIAHHGSNHGIYINKTNLSTLNNFKHEWELFETIEEGVKVSSKGIEIFKNIGISIVGGKFCGYKKRDNSLEIIDKCKFNYWCDNVNFNLKEYSHKTFGKNRVISFPTNVAGNIFIRLSYLTGNKNRDRQKKVTKYFQPLYSLIQYFYLLKLYKNRYIISIQEHISPSTSSGLVQSTNIVTDSKSLNKIYNFFKNKSIWYSTCKEISNYIYIKENSILIIEDNYLIIEFNNYKKIENTIISIDSTKEFSLIIDNKIRYSTKNNNRFVINLNIINGKNKFLINRGLK